MRFSRPARPLPSTAAAVPPSSRRTPAILLLSVLTGLTAFPAGAQDFMYKCRAPGGGWLFSDRPCEVQGARQTNRPAEEPPEAPLAPPTVEQLAARARELTVRPQAVAAAQAAVDAPPGTPARRPRATASAPAASVVGAPAPGMEEIDPDGLLRQPLVKYRSPLLDALAH